MFPRGLLKQYSVTLSLIARLLDVIAVILAAFIAHVLRFGNGTLSADYRVAIVLVVFLVLFIFPLFGLYHSWRGKSRILHLRTLTSAWVTVIVSVIVIAFVTKTSADYSRQWLLAWGGLTWLFMFVLRILMGQILRKMREKGFNHKKIIIAGAGELGRNVLKHVREAYWTGLDVVAFLDDDKDLHFQYVEGVLVEGSVNDVERIAKHHQVDEVWIALPLANEKRVYDVLHRLRHTTFVVRYVPDFFGYRLLMHKATEIAGLAVLDLSVSPMTGINRLVKALEDRLIALTILVLISPIMLLIAIGVKLTSPGPIIFKQLRHGWDGKPIEVYKFRTMHVHQEDPGCVTQARKEDPRVTRFGRFLRKTSLDELPQFFNVLQGHMSIVGPRPHAVEHNEFYKDQIDDYMKRHKVKPGITGWAQINGWRGETDTLDKMKKRVEYDLYYIDNWSLWFDLKIILLTIFKGFINKNAY